ncbi:hypothetical protein [Methylosinus sp. PW1]|uniref:hypothetical protein n=1 Tax=Methylosinus sp. PW1 TaxID=107636 RepID=UPI0005642CF2|nr:hypothetical protein [Methylosinus sp. PW1]
MDRLAEFHMHVDETPIEAERLLEELEIAAEASFDRRFVAVPCLQAIHVIKTLLDRESSVDLREKMAALREGISDLHDDVLKAMKAQIECLQLELESYRREERRKSKTSASKETDYAQTQ